MKIRDKAEELASKEGMFLKSMTSPIGIKGIWYKNKSNELDNWFWYADNWTKAHKRLSKYRKWKSERRKILRERKKKKEQSSS